MRATFPPVKRGRPSSWAGRTAIILCLWLFSGCDDNSKELPERQLERPVSAAFFCARKDAQGHWMHDSLQACRENPANTRNFAVIATSARGELALADLKDKKLVDLDPLSPGYNFFPVGTQLQDMIYDDDAGIVTVAASRPTRLVRVPVNALLALARGETPEDAPATEPLDDHSQPVAAIPFALEPHAQGTDIWITFPGCQALARVDGAGHVVSAYRLSGMEPYVEPFSLAECPDELSPSQDATPVAWNPMPMAAQETTLFVGLNAAIAGADDILLAVDLDADSGEPLTAAPVQLDGPTHGLRKLRITPQTRWGRFLYAVTFSGDIRVVRLSDRVECETQADTRQISGIALDSPERGCLPVGTVPRHFLASTPGIQIGENRMIQDVAFFERPENTENEDPREKTTLLGIFGAAASWDGVLYIINLDEAFTQDVFDYRLGPAGGQSWPEEVLAHRFRNAVDIGESSSSGGRPRVETPISYYIADSPTLPAAGQAQLAPFDDGLYLHDMDGYFMRSETWNLVWEGVLPGTLRDWGVADRDASSAPDLLFYDMGANYCASGVRPGDVLRIIGCDSSEDCEDGYVCRRTPMQRQDLPGLCFPREQAQNFTNACSRFLASDREFLVADVWADTLLLSPLVYSDPQTNNPVTCTTDLDCRGYGWKQGAVCSKAENENEGVCTGTLWPQADDFWCLAGPQRYEVRVQGAFLLTGSGTPYRPYREAAGVQQACTDIPGAFDYRLPRTTGDHATPFFTLRLTSDDAATLPVQYRAQFNILAGFGRFGKDVSVRFPSWVGAGPDGYLYILDMADSSGGASYIGQFVRVLARNLALDDSFQIR